MSKQVKSKQVKSKPKYYSLNRIKKKNAVYNVIFGERSNGKTYAVLKEGLEQYVKTGGQIAVVRRWKEDITGKRASGIWNALIENREIEKLTDGEFTGIHYWNGKFYLCNYKDNKVVYHDTDIIGYTFALSDNEHNKSISYPKVTTILFDEFLTKHLYLNDEFVLFMNTISTIVRQRTNVTIYMLGNTVNKYCPYFQEMGLNHVQKMEQGTIDVYRYGDSKLTVAVEYCASTQNKKANNFYFAF
ncbi:MAG TPA: phage DNA encapsidation protein, partial [Bacteroidales bacterium]|nr:phage DNA encapsidation protein [Bacteroidales bacterium]